MPASREVEATSRCQCHLPETLELASKIGSTKPGDGTDGGVQSCGACQIPGNKSRTDNKDRIKEITLIRRTTVSAVYARSREMDSIDGERASPADIPNEGAKTGAKLGTTSGIS